MMDVDKLNHNGEKTMLFKAHLALNDCNVHDSLVFEIQQSPTTALQISFIKVWQNMIQRIFK